MIKYPHFALPNLFLENGYVREGSEYGEVTTYQDEDGLEECIRRILVHSPQRLNGRQLRFLRRGLGLSQEAFGELIDRDGQTVARMEKSNDETPRYVDLAARTRYFAHHDPSKAIGEILSIHDLNAKVPQERIVLFYSAGKWCYRYDIPRLRFEIVQAETTIHDRSSIEITDGTFVMRWVGSSATDTLIPEEQTSRSDSPRVAFSKALPRQTYASNN